jgi:hypothetical protein
MEWLQAVPSAVWETPIQVLVIVLLSLGVFVTKREHMNMTKMMEHYRTVSENKDKVIDNQVESLNVMSKELVPLLKEVLAGLKKVANEKRDDVQSQKEE